MPLGVAIEVVGPLSLTTSVATEVMDPELVISASWTAVVVVIEPSKGRLA
jgi:hypothetical protein